MITQNYSYTETVVFNPIYSPITPQIISDTGFIIGGSVDGNSVNFNTISSSVLYNSYAYISYETNASGVEYTYIISKINNGGEGKRSLGAGHFEPSISINSPSGTVYFSTDDTVYFSTVTAVVNGVNYVFSNVILSNVLADFFDIENPSDGGGFITVTETISEE
jgi:hypothetical protein